MNLHNVVNKTCRIFPIAIGLLIGSLPAQASVTYRYTSAPIFVGDARNLLADGNVVQTKHGILENVANPPSIDVGEPVTATLTFASPLAANSIIPLHLESGGFNLRGPTQGGLQAYYADGLTSTNWPITSDISKYDAGHFGNIFDYARYSALDGQVTTDASGHISAWKLDFSLYDDGQGGGIRLDQTNNSPTIVGSFGFSTDALLSISNNSGSHQTFTDVTLLNGVPNTDDFGFNGADLALENRGDVLFTYYTQQPGSIMLVPEAETWAMLMVGLGLVGFMARRRKQIS